MDLQAQMQADQGIGVSDEGIAELAKLAQNQVYLEQEIARMTEKLAGLTGELKTISEKAIPDLMTTLGVSEFKLTDGSKVTVKPFYGASISKEAAPREAAFKWLKDNGHDDIIKNEVSVRLGRGEDQKAEEAVQALKELGLSPEQDRSVHASTLKAFVREQVEAGITLPPEFNVFVGRKAKIDIPRSK